MSTIYKKALAIAVSMAVLLSGAICLAPHAHAAMGDEASPYYAYRITSVIDTFDEFKTDLYVIKDINPIYKDLYYESGFSRTDEIYITTPVWGFSGTAYGTWARKQYCYTTW